MKSIWNENVEIPERPPLPGDMSVEAAVIGAGMAGILISYFLKQKGIKVIVLEADRIAGGQTKNTTAKITSQHGLIYNKLIHKYGHRKARLYAGAHEDAVDMFQKIIEEKNIDCDFERLPSYLYSTRDRRKLMHEAMAAEQIGLPACFLETISLPFETVGAVRFDNQAQFHPLKFIYAVSQELEIYEQTKVLSVNDHIIQTNHGNVTAGKIIFATHYPFINIPGYFFLRQHQERSYVAAFSGADKLDGMYYSIDKKGISLRSWGDYLLIGSGSHRTGYNEDGGHYEHIRNMAGEYFKDAEEVDCWSAQDCITHDSLQFIGRYSSKKPYWYVATGFRKWGMTSSMLSAMIISDEICGEKNKYAHLFSPQRLHILASLKKLLMDAGVSIKGLVKGYHLFYCENEADIMRGHGGIIRRGLKRYGCFKDDDGNLHIISLRCPHMGCQLLWNQDELSWDCPCHGSRFDYDGNLIDNPAQINKK